MASAPRQTARAVHMRENALLAGDGLKRCSRCAEVKDLAESFRVSKAGIVRPECAECDRAACRARHAANPEPYRENARRWAAANPESVRRKSRVARSRRRALLREAFVENVDPQKVWERDEGVCGICGVAADRDSFDVDHIVPLALGGEHSYANVRVAHIVCNRQRGRLVATANSTRGGTL